MGQNGLGNSASSTLLVLIALHKTCFPCVLQLAGLLPHTRGTLALVSGTLPAIEQRMGDAANMEADLSNCSPSQVPVTLRTGLRGPAASTPHVSKVRSSCEFCKQFNRTTAMQRVSFPVQNPIYIYKKSSLLMQVTGKAFSLENLTACAHCSSHLPVATLTQRVSREIAGPWI